MYIGVLWEGGGLAAVDDCTWRSAAVLWGCSPRSEAPLNQHPPTVPPSHEKVFHLLPPCDAWRLGFASLPAATYEPCGSRGRLQPVIDPRKRRVTWSAADPHPKGNELGCCSKSRHAWLRSQRALPLQLAGPETLPAPPKNCVRPQTLLQREPASPTFGILRCRAPWWLSCTLATCSTSPPCGEWRLASPRRCTLACR